jgi:hypothetical protein
MMNALTIADLRHSQDLDREALGATVGSGIYGHGGIYAAEAYRADYIGGSWSDYYGGIVLTESYNNGQKYRAARWTRQRTQYEYSYWNYYYYT